MFEHEIQIIINKCNYSLTTDFYFFNENLDREEIITNVENEKRNKNKKSFILP